MPKNNYVRIRLDDEEREIIELKAKAENKTITKFILEKVLPEKYKALEEIKKRLTAVQPPAEMPETVST